MVKKQTSAKRKSARGGGDAGGQTSASSKEPSATGTAAHVDDDDDSVPQQQRLLNHFAAAFEPVLAADDFAQRVQAIKQALFQRDFAAAFGRADHLAAYAARWSPTRALCYARIFQTHLPPHLHGDAQVSEASSQRHIRMVSVGGCAAEHVAFANYLQNSQPLSQNHSTTGDLVLLDSAPWATVAATMQDTLTTPLPQSKYASSSARAANLPFLQTPEQLRLQVLQQDALQLNEAQWVDIFTLAAADPAVVVVTLLFTLNELYTNGGISKTTKFLKALEATLPDQALLLVVDSPGSFAEAALGKDKKKYPMQWLLHHTLTDPASMAQRWTRLESDDSIWFRLSDQLKYPIPLENMRYQLHLYRIHKSPQL
ncbi:hypothetical protein LMH87_000840 [Akanthomyces muscarius]|uniref:25S rRNA (Uridine(2843)-N(3))-methyltransferase n=1 Tax=Akanthomyces muscarius TaxID=2231603 RepID=A0A9W8QI52_AKAMU|nr:hypothetical protein LMH87_000840 [Akanthomyces muscarius]KAJ4155603.1 hypothetical protein LMH87_000840 [Akanthomyces muscarius]